MTDPKAEVIIGCVDGAVVRVVSDGNGAHLHFNGGVAHLSRSGAALLAAALVHEAPESRPAVQSRIPARQPRGTSSRMGTGINPSMGDLVAEGYLEEGETLTLTYRGHEYTARVTASGEIEHDGVCHGSPSAAAKAATGTYAMNGWVEWHIGDEGPISDLRWWLRADQFPGDGHRYADSSANQMRLVAGWWVEHTLSKGIDPSTPDETEIEALLGGQGYAEKTMESYRQVLRNWFALYGRDAKSAPKSEHDDDSDALTP